MGNNHTIIVQQPSNEDMGSSFKSLLAIVSQTKAVKPNDTITFDLRNLTFVYPFLILPLSGLISHYRNKDIEVKILYSSACKSYLDTIKFENDINTASSDSKIDSLEYYRTKTYLPVCVIPSQKESSKEREELLTVFEDILVSQLNIKGQLRTAISYLLSEAITNIVDHAQIENGYIMVQNYPNKEFLDVCIIDTGIGIKQSYDPIKYPNIITDSDAMNNAVNGKSTKKQAVSRGYGISTSRKMLVKGMHGKYFLFSGGAFYFFSNENEVINEVDDSFKWDGTMLALRIPKTIPNIFNYIDFLE